MGRVYEGVIILRKHVSNATLIIGIGDLDFLLIVNVLYKNLTWH